MKQHANNDLSVSILRNWLAGKGLVNINVLR